MKEAHRNINNNNKKERQTEYASLSRNGMSRNGAQASPLIEQILNPRYRMQPPRSFKQVWRHMQPRA
jgi:hypothetical protein